jgi:maleylacetoacetate isomerase
MRLHSYFRSSAAFRVRIALNLKGVDYQIVPTNLLDGQHRSQAYLGINPQGLVPALELDGGEILVQSPAILEWLEERYPEPPLYPADPLARARMRALCFHIACDVHPVDNLRVLKYLGDELGVGEPARNAWYQHWIRLAFTAIEPAIARPFCAGGEPSMADVYLVPQVFNALRFRLDMAPFPRLSEAYQQALQHPAFDRAHPDRQPDRIT